VPTFTWSPQLVSSSTPRATGSGLAGPEGDTSITGSPGRSAAGRTTPASALGSLTPRA
jgi:hypothetical protein